MVACSNSPPADDEMHAPLRIITPALHRRIDRIDGCWLLAALCSLHACCGVCVFVCPCVCGNLAARACLFFHTAEVGSKLMHWSLFHT